MIRISNLSKSYNEVKALDDISFTVQKGEITGFLGPNGAGKTTMLRILAGFLEEDSGDAKFDEKSIKSHYQEIISKSGYLPENNPLYTNMRVDEFLLFIAKIRNVTEKEQLTTISKKCGIEEVLTKEIEQLSKGYKQRVGLAKSLIGDPQYLLLDEPTTGLDPNQKEEVLKLIKSYGKEKTILFSSHVLSEVSQIADKIIIIHEGKIVAEGDSKKLAKEHLKRSTITITTDAPFTELKPAMMNIKSIQDINKVSTRSKKFQNFEINCLDPEETSLGIFDKIVENNWKLTQIYTKTQGLEDLFKQLTR